MLKKKILKKLVKYSKENAPTAKSYKAGTDLSISGLKEAIMEANPTLENIGKVLSYINHLDLSDAA
jgi:hypothetical protein